MGPVPAVALSSFSLNRGLVPALSLAFAHDLSPEPRGPSVRRDIVDSYYKAVWGEGGCQASWYKIEIPGLVGKNEGDLDLE